jgi:predicted small lipoprotein YifL
MKRSFVVLVALLAAACQQEGPSLPPVGVAAEDAGPAAEMDMCKSADFTYLVGQPRSALGSVEFPEGTRVLLPGSIMTQEYLPNRLNVVVDGNATVERLYCG